MSNDDPQVIQTTDGAGPVLERHSVAQATDWRRSDCCYATVTQHREVHAEHEPDEPDDPDRPHDTEHPDGLGQWASVHHVCDACGQECACWTHPLLARLMAERDGKEVQDDA